MEEKNIPNRPQRNHQGMNFFDNLMFGSSLRSLPQEQREGSIKEDEKKEEQSVNLEPTNQEPLAGKKETQTNNPVPPQLDLTQMMEQFDMLMGYANKLGPSLKKIAPLFDLFKGGKK